MAQFLLQPSDLSLQAFDAIEHIVEAGELQRLQEGPGVREGAAKSPGSGTEWLAVSAIESSSLARLHPKAVAAAAALRRTNARGRQRPYQAPGAPNCHSAHYITEVRFYIGQYKTVDGGGRLVI